jgi:hypothetical protein
MAVAVLCASLALGVTSSAWGDNWGRDHTSQAALAELDPAIRTAITARSTELVAVPPATHTSSVPEQGFAWGDAFVGAAVGIAGMCLVLGCVTLVRHDGRLRSA